MNTVRKPWLLEFRSSEFFVVAVVCVAIFTDMFAYSMIVPIIPRALVERAGVSEENVQSWVSVSLAVYGVTLLLGSPLFGYFADRNESRTGPFILGLVALAASIGLFMLSTSPVGFIIARALQGFSGAAVWVVGLALIVDTVNDDRIGEAMGYISIGMTWGTLFGPSAGGFMYERLGFFKTFYVPIGIIVLDIVLRMALLDKRSVHQWQQSLPDDESVPSNPSWNNAGRNETSPLLPRDSVSGSRTSNKPQLLRLLRVRRLQISLVVTVVMMTLLAALEATVPLFVMRTFHWTSTNTGLVFLAMSTPSLASSLSGKTVDKFGPRLVISTTCAIATLAMILLRLVQHDTTTDHIILICLLAITGATITTNSLGAMTEVFQVVYGTEAYESGTLGDAGPISQAYALFSMACAGGGLLGSLMGGLLVVSAGWKSMSLVLALLCAVTGVMYGAFGGGRQSKGKGPATREGGR